MDGLSVLPHRGHSCETKFSIVISIDQRRTALLGNIGCIAVRQAAIGDSKIGKSFSAQCRGSIVPSSPQSPTATERLRCSHCQTRMMLERISPGPIGFERRLFECPRCNRVEISVIASNPFKSTAAAGSPANRNDRLSANSGEAPMLDTQNRGPQCTACGSPMRLVAIEPSMPGQNLRTFSCPRCKRIQRHVIDIAVTEAWAAPRP